MVRFILTMVLLLFGVFASAARDPTMPQGGLYLGGETIQEESPASLTATLVLVGDARRVALVNNRTLEVGDTFEGGKVLSINDNGVEVLGADGEIIFLPVQAVQKKADWKFIKVYRNE